MWVGSVDPSSRLCQLPISSYQFFPSDEAASFRIPLTQPGTTPPATAIAAVLHGQHLRVAYSHPASCPPRQRRLQQSPNSTLVFRTSASVVTHHLLCDLSNLPSHRGNLRSRP